jgi:putative tryptophan/tyrosine transport system ATP-binding protein
MTAIRLNSVTKRFRGPGGSVTALDKVELEIPSGQFVVIVGHNGSGKSTLLNLLAGKEMPDEGVISMNSASGDADARGTPNISFVEQDPRRGTADDLSVAEHLHLATLKTSPSIFGRIDQGRRASASGLQEKLSADAESLSGGQRQLLTLEMAAAGGASLILLDEPTASLDRVNATYCLSEIERLNSTLGATIILATHDLVAAARMGDRLIVLVDGQVKWDKTNQSKRSLSAEDIFRLIETGEDLIS